MNERLEREFAESQDQLIKVFKEKMRKVCESILGDLYTDVASYASSDAHVNYHNYLKSHFQESLIKEITEEYTHYSWAHSIRMKLLEKYPEQLRTKIISDLQDKIKSQEEHIESLRRRW